MPTGAAILLKWVDWQDGRGKGEGNDVSDKMREENRRLSVREMDARQSQQLAARTEHLLGGDCRGWTQGACNRSCTRCSGEWKIVRGGGKLTGDVRNCVRKNERS